MERHYAQRRKEIQEHAQQEQQEQPKVSTPNDRLVSPDFLKIIPRNTKAKLAFSELIESRNSDKLDKHHTQFLVSTGRGPLKKRQALQHVSSDEAEDGDWSDQSENEEVNFGYFRVNFDCHPLTSTAKWVIGRGSQKKTKKMEIVSRNVDILLVAPDSKYSRYLLPSHAFLNMHPESGVWMIFAAIGSTVDQASKADLSSSSPKATIFIDGEKVLEQDFRCLTKPQTPLDIQDMQFTVQFDLETFADAVKFRELRDKILQEQEIDPPKSQLSGIPLESDIRVKELAIFSLGLGSGTFGSVYEGFSPISGDLRAVKVWDIKNKEIGESIREELTMSVNFSDATGLVRQYGWYNSNGDTLLDVPTYPIKIYLVLEKGLAFHQHNWSVYGPDKDPVKVRLCHQLLTGLATMHAKGYMHRDITRQNILFFEAKPQRSQPERAALCDFGKVYQGASSTYTRLAAWANLPPEIVPGKANPYGHKIDVWMLALALVLCWYPEKVADVERWKPHGQITSKGLRLIQQRLEEESNHLSRLLSKMLREQVDFRPSASQALASPCFQALTAKPAGDEKPGDAKRART